tara:strand:+ start:335 stop:739 length:405 start_codon:yes stop_codon:yes gene_type:complete
MEVLMSEWEKAKLNTGVNSVSNKTLTATDFIESKYPETSQLLRDLQDMQYKLFCSKQQDYGSGNISLGGDMSNDNDKKFAMLGLTIRMNDKMQRLLNLIKDDKKPNNESIEDTLIDISTYALMTIIVKKGAWTK